MVTRSASQNNMNDNKIATLFYYDCQSGEQAFSCEEDTVLICETLKGLDFEILSEDSFEDEVAIDSDDAEDDVHPEDEDSSGSDTEMNHVDKQIGKNSTSHSSKGIPVMKNIRPIDLDKFLKKVADEKSCSSCILLYFIVPQEGYEFKTREGKTLPLFNMWKKFTGASCPVLFFIQANVTEGAIVQDVLFNKDNSSPESLSSAYVMPEASNMLLAYLPRCIGAKKSVAQILSEELPKPYDINTCLTQVIAQLNAMDCRPNPKFSSTLLNPLYLSKREKADILMSVEPPGYTIKRKCLVYAFLFAKFNDETLMELTSMLEKDRESIEKTFTEPAFELEFSVPENGIMTVNEFRHKLYSITSDAEKMESCDCIMIILSSHGGESDVVFTYDGHFRMDEARRALSMCKELKGKPKVIIRDACRGGGFEVIHYDELKKVKHTVIDNSALSIPLDLEMTKDYCEMTDVLVAMASTKRMESFGTYCHGSLFIEALCNYINEKRNEDMLTVLQVVIKTIAERTIPLLTDEGCLENAKQLATFTSTLQKTLKLPVNK
ncbi:uncharacterized protein [Hetaerina americana]|uniref:uncharacterized protein n=1 Tax=Hetaerina americana TaxID=62018 RepID=UPI003A7F2776